MQRLHTVSVLIAAIRNQVTQRRESALLMGHGWWCSDPRQFTCGGCRRAFLARLGLGAVLERISFDDRGRNQEPLLIAAGGQPAGDEEESQVGRVYFALRARLEEVRAKWRLA